MSELYFDILSYGAGPQPNQEVKNMASCVFCNRLTWKLVDAFMATCVDCQKTLDDPDPYKGNLTRCMATDGVEIRCADCQGDLMEGRYEYVEDDGLDSGAFICHSCLDKKTPSGQVVICDECGAELRQATIKVDLVGRQILILCPGCGGREDEDPQPPEWIRCDWCGSQDFKHVFETNTDKPTHLPVTFYLCGICYKSATEEGGPDGQV